jgi:hypothetical protein
MGQKYEICGLRLVLKIYQIGRNQVVASLLQPRIMINGNAGDLEWDDTACVSAWENFQRQNLTIFGHFLRIKRLLMCH